MINLARSKKINEEKKEKEDVDEILLEERLLLSNKQSHKFFLFVPWFWVCELNFATCLVIFSLFLVVELLTYFWE